MSHIPVHFEELRTISLVFSPFYWVLKKGKAIKKKGGD
jgi:hypothetical protein